MTQPQRRGRLLRGTVSLFLATAALSAGCTTSQAVRRWHAAAEAEQKGDLGAAIAGYKEAYSLDSSLVGAELNRLRLLAGRPGQKATVDKRLKELLTRHPSRAEVNLFAAAWALRGGGDKAAASADAYMKATQGVTRADRPHLRRAKKPTGCGPHQRVRAQLLVQVARASERWDEVNRLQRRWRKRCPSLAPALFRAQAEMYLAKGRARDARRSLGQMTKAGGRAPRWLSAEVAFLLGERERLGRLIRGRRDDRARVLRAWLAWSDEQPRRALAQLRRPRKTGEQDRVAAELQAASLLSLSRWGEALPLLKRLVKGYKRPTYSALFNLGVAAIKTGQIGLARTMFERAGETCVACQGAKHNLSVLGLTKRP